MISMGNGQTNLFFTPKNSAYKYITENVDPESTVGKNNYMIFEEQVPQNSLVLDVGCGQGNYEYLKRKNCKLYGLDYDPSAIETINRRADSCYAKAYVANLTDKNDTGMKELFDEVSEFDVLIFSDILEHLPDPTSVLLDLLKHLKHKGVALVSIPNIAHMDIILGLLNGKFNYSPLGILDNTHLKFFTKHSFAEWIDEINNEFDVRLDCELLDHTFYDTDSTKRVEMLYPELYSILCGGTQRNGLQLLFKLTKLDIDDCPSQLCKLLLEKDTDVVTNLGLALQGEAVKLKTPDIVKGEKRWFEKQMDMLKDEAEQLHAKDRDLNKIFERQKNYIQELENNLRTVDHERINQQNYIAELETKLQQLSDEVVLQNEYIDQIDRIYNNLRQKKQL